MLLKKSFGQHFLKDESICKKIVEAADIMPGDFVIEIGPGAGALTHFISERILPSPTPIGDPERNSNNELDSRLHGNGKEKKGGHKRLALIEADHDLIPSLEKNYPAAEIIQADAAQIDFDKITREKSWIFLGNLPYNAASAIIVNALTSKNPPKKMIFMVQKEQADRMLAKPGDMGLLSVVVQLHAKGKKLFNVKPGSFVPPPKIISSVIELRGGVFPELFQDQKEQIIQLAKAGFSNRRKQLHKNLNDAGIANSSDVKEALAGIKKPPTARAQELSVKEWILLFESISN